MFKISPIQEKEIQKKYAECCGADFVFDALAYAMINQNDGTLMGMSQFDIRQDTGYIHNISSAIGYSDFEAMFILGRATMNFIDLCGNHECLASKTAADESFLKALGFKKNESGEFYADTNGMFDGNCGGHSAGNK